MPIHSSFMRRAIRLAERARGKTSPNPFVGAVIVKNKKILSAGYTQPAGNDHAEIVALKKAGEKAQGATLYVTLEPCCHTGRTAPCTEAIIQAGIKEVIIGIKDPNPRVNGEGIRQLKQAGIGVRVGVLQDEIRRQNEIFIHYITTGLPFVCLKTACSLNGKISDAYGRSFKLTCQATDRYVHQLRSQYDAIMVGINTVLIDDPQLTCRLVRGKNPIRIILDSKLKIPLKARVLQNDGAGIIIITDKKSPKPGKINKLKTAGATILPTTLDRRGRIPIKKMLKKLLKQNITSILVEGGERLNTELIERRLLDSFCFIYTPYIIGGAAPKMFDVQWGGFSPVRDLRHKKYDRDIVIEGRISD